MSVTGTLGNKPSGWWYVLAGAFVAAAFVAALTIVSTTPSLTSVGSPQFFGLHNGVGVVTVSKPDHYGIFINGTPRAQAISVTGPQDSSVETTQQSVAGAFFIDGRARHLVAIFTATRTGQYRFQLRGGGDMTMIIGQLQLSGLAQRVSIAVLIWIGLILCGIAAGAVTLVRRISWQRRADRDGGDH
ncbi:MAG TPA: hypothetical protein VIA06_01625 [Candidatus Dormibacteraeota bacterium]|jgi:hypothetical protein|nr:hypothetical protein [Candidatus Dormibacteraeota bacterium]